MLRCILLLFLTAVVPLAGQQTESRAAEEYFVAMRAYPFGRIPSTARADALEQARALDRRGSSARLQSASTWRSIGPFHIGGRVNAIAIHPLDPDIVWIGAADGGVWKSTDGGAAWRPVMDDAGSLALGAIAVDPNDPSVLYAGTGEAAYNLDTYTGAGIFKSTDGGETWRVSGLTTVASFAKIVVLPGSSVVLAAAVRNNGGIYRSSDGGATWSRRAVEPAFDLTVNPRDPDEVWAGVAGSGVLHSTDGGVTFSADAVGFASDGASVGRVSLQVAPSDPRTLFALSSEFIPPDRNATRIYRSRDAGAHWTLVLEDQPNILNYYGNFQGTYNNVIAVSPDDADLVVAGGVIMARSTDAGESWERVGTNVHLDFHALAFAPSGDHRLYVGNDGGVYRGDSLALTFERMNRGLAITQFYGMDVDQRAADVTYGGTQDNGTLATTAEEFLPGAPGVVSGSDGFHVAVDRTSSDIVWVEHPYGDPYRVDLRTGSELHVTAGLSSSDRGAWSAPLVMNPLDAGVLYLGRTRLYRFSSRSSVWRPITAPFHVALSAVGVSPIDTSIVYAGSGGGELRVTTDAGASWREVWVGSGLPDRAVTDIAPSPSSRSTAVVSYSGFHSGHVFRTRDGGATWQDISQRLPDIPVNAVQLDPLDSNTIYVGTDIGVFFTGDAGLTWARLGAGLPAVVVVDLALHESSRTLRAATHGRSMYEIALGDVARERQIVAPVGGERWVGTSTRSIVWTGLDEPVALAYSLDDGATWIAIGGSTIGGAYRWRVPDVAATARVRATSVADASQSVTSGSFTIEPNRPGIVIDMARKPVSCHGLAFDGEVLWATSEFGDTLVKIDPATLSTIDFVRVRGLPDGMRFSDVAWSAARGSLFIHASDDPFPSEPGHGYLLEVDRTNGVILHQWSSPCVLPVGLATIDDPVAGPSLLASDLLGEQSLFVIDPSTGQTVREIARDAKATFGPMGITSDAQQGVFWQVIADFNVDEGPRGSTAVRMSLASQRPTCAFQLATSADSSSALGDWSWGRLFARGIERDPRDDGFWVTNLDGAIYKVTGCAGAISSAPDGAVTDIAIEIAAIAPSPAHAAASVTVVSRAALVGATLDVVDARGDVVRSQAIERLDAGEHRLAIDLQGLASGFYTVTVSARSARASRGIVVVE
jgi:photosystem II stability/assembly factor-like uncharacterized protein